jgi:carbonic anhydrase/acetyltransferase-like protein (isoleucine patch superfamily)
MAVYALDAVEPSIHETAFVHPHAVVIGQVHVGAYASIWPGAVLRGDYGSIQIGERTSVQDGAVIHATEELGTVIGAACVIGHLAHLEGCVVETGCLIASGSSVLNRATVRSGAFVAAGAVVPTGLDVPSGAIAFGVPARIRPEAVSPDFGTSLAASVERYVANACRHRTGLRRME